MRVQPAGLCAPLLCRDHPPLTHAASRRVCCLVRTRATLQVFTGDDVAEEYGVNKSSYEAVVLPNIRAYQARAQRVSRSHSLLYVHARTRTR